MAESFTETERRTIYRKSADMCWYCGRARAAHVEHQTPKALEGTSHLSNLVGACAECNRQKAGHRVSGNPNWTLEQYRAQVAAALAVPAEGFKFYGERLDALRRAYASEHPGETAKLVLRGLKDDLLPGVPEPLPMIVWNPPYVYEDDSL